MIVILSLNCRHIIRTGCKSFLIELLNCFELRKKIDITITTNNKESEYGMGNTVMGRQVFGSILFSDESSVTLYHSEMRILSFAVLMIMRADPQLRPQFFYFMFWQFSGK